MFKEQLMTNAQKRIDRIAVYYEEKGSILNHLVECMEPLDVYHVFKADIETIEGAEHIRSVVNQGLYDDIALGVVKDEYGTYYVGHISDYCDSERIEEDDLMEILNARSRISKYYEENKGLIERYNGEPLENPEYRLALKEYGRLNRLYDETLYKFMNSEDRSIYEQSVAQRIARRDRIIAKLKEKRGY